jgi:pimeloyl-ACP methyl ester carboxylesterase
LGCCSRPFGAAAAIEFAASFPDRTEHLVLVNGGFGLLFLVS